LIFALSFALLQLTKYTAIITIPFFITILIIHSFWTRKPLNILKNLCILTITTWFVISTAYTFQGIGIPLSELIHLDPHLAPKYKTQPLPHILTIIPSPIPYHYLKGLGFVLLEGKKPTHNKMFDTNSTTGFRTYFLTAFALKTTLGLIALILLAIGITIYKKKITKEEAILLALAAFLIVVMSFSTKQIGIRYVLPVYPLLIIFASKLANHCTRQGVLCTAILFFTLYHTAAGVSALPNPLGYYNEFIQPENGWKAFADSNTDWGQDINELITYLHNNTADTLSVLTTQDLTFYNITIPPTPTTCTPSKHIISVYQLFIGNAQWLQKYTFTDRIGTSIFVYDITQCSTHTIVEDKNK
jgi:4-amino-4-deoxy-L-arabinose transferase-like glycosyltransferase